MRHVESGGLASWLANIERFNLRDRIRVRGDEIGETMENHRTIIHGHRGPASVATTCKVNASLSEHPPCQRRGTRTKSAFQDFIAHRLPALDQISLLSAAGRLSGGTIVGMQMRCAIGDGIIQPYVPL